MSAIALPFSGTGPLLLFLAKATLLLGAAAIATSTLHRSTAGARHLVWLAALVGVLALPVLSRIPALQLGVLPSTFGSDPRATEFARAGAVGAAPVRAVRATPAPAQFARAVGPMISGTPAARGATPVPVEITHRRPAAAPGINAPVGSVVATPNWTSLITIGAAIWGVVAIALLGWLVAGAIHVRRIVRNARELTASDWTMPLCEVADRLDLETPPRLVISDRTEMAFACRAFSPTIVLPEAAESWSDDRRRAVLFHELAHVKRHDLIGHTLGRIACALYWFHPLVWTAAKNLRNESERACDDLVLRCGARPSEYAQHLLDMVTSVRNYRSPVMALPMAQKKEFEGRLLAILDPDIRRTSPGRLQAAGMIASLTLLSLTVAAVSPASARNSARDVTLVAAAPSASVRATGPVSTAPAALAGTPVGAAPIASSVAPTPSPTPTPSLAAAPTRLTVGVLAQLGAQLAHPTQRGDTGRVTALIRILETDPDASVRRTAAWGLNEIGAERVRAALVKALRTDASAEVREMSAWALGEQSGDAAASALADALLHDKSTQVRMTSGWALGQMNGHRQQGALESAVSDSAAMVRHVAIWALGQLGLRTASPVLINALTDRSSDVRLVAAWALGEIEDKATALAIAKAFETETDGSVRAAELRALSAMGAVPQSVIDAALASNDVALRRRAVAALAGNGSDVWPWPWPWPRPTP